VACEAYLRTRLFGGPRHDVSRLPAELGELAGLRSSDI
jgi:hypothetical protein